MKFTDNYNLNLPDKADQYNLNHWNKNTTEIDDLIKTRENEFNAHNSDLENPHQVKGSQLIEPVPTEKIADLSIVTDKIADRNVTMKKLAQAVQECLSPVGTIRTGLWKTAPDGWLLCNGEKVLISDYPKLYQCAVDNGWLKQDSDITRFYLPDLRGRFLEGSTSIGEYKEAGLPNITGTFTQYTYDTSQITGAFSEQVLNDTGKAGSGPDTQWSKTTLDASKGETKTDGTVKTEDEAHVYGNSDTVQPASYTVNYIIKY